jgi:hypothetical protein
VFLSRLCYAAERGIKGMLIEIKPGVNDGELSATPVRKDGTRGRAVLGPSSVIEDGVRLLASWSGRTRYPELGALQVDELSPVVRARVRSEIVLRADGLDDCVDARLVKE